MNKGKIIRIVGPVVDVEFTADSLPAIYNSVVVRNITEVVQALFDVDSHKIKVIKGKQIN